MDREKLLKSQKERSVLGTEKRDSLYSIASSPNQVDVVNHTKFLDGFTLVNVLLAVLLLTIAFLGASFYRYRSALDARGADIHITAARLASLLCESWRGVRGTETYDLTADLDSELEIETIYEGPEVPAEAGLLGYYIISIEDIDYYTFLWWSDVSPGLRSLNVAVSWNWRNSDSWWPWNYKTFKLTTYTVM